MVLRSAAVQGMRAPAVVPTPCAAPLASPALALETQALSAELQRRYPIDQYFHLYVGRSPVLLAKALLQRFPAAGRLVAYSGGATPYHLLGQRGLSRASPPLNPKAQAKLFAYFDRVIPSDPVLAGRALVAIDYAVSGAGLKSFLSYLQLYLRERHRSVRVVGAALTQTPEPLPPIVRDFGPLERAYGLEVATVSLQSRFPLTSTLLGAAPPELKQLAPYGRFDPSKDAAPLR